MSASADDAVAPSSPASSSERLDKTSITSKCLACAPVTALEFLAPSNLLLAAQGPLLKLYDAHKPKKPIHELKLWSFQRIHGIVRFREEETEVVERLIVFGGKQVAVVVVDREKSSLSIEAAWFTNDWLLAACWLGNQTILLLTSHNTLARYDISLQDIVQHARPTLELHCHERPLLWSACFSKPRYDDEEDVYVAVGTIMNEILVWRPFVDEGRIERRFIGHHGSVFFVIFSPSSSKEKGYTLASGSDDRDIRLWSWKAGTAGHQSAILRGHTHRPWKATFCKASRLLVTVGEDLRCLLWDIVDLSPTSPMTPVGQYKGHEGKNIWSVTVSERLNTIATGGSDGAVRLWPLDLDQDSKTVFTAHERDVIVAFDVSQKHVAFLTRKGDVYHYLNEDDAEAPRLLFKVKSNQRALQAEISLQGDSIWIFSREGRSYSMQIYNTGSLQNQDMVCVPVVISGRMQGKQWALYDRRTRTVQIWESGENRLLGMVAKSAPLEQDKLPKFLIWLDGTTLLVADAISSIWVLEWKREEANISIRFQGRLAAKGTFALQKDSRKAGKFWVGNKDGCLSYRLIRKGDEVELQLLSTGCLHYGVVKEVHVGDSRIGRLYLTCDNTSRRIVNDAGDILATVHCPASSAQTLRLSVQGDRLRFYSNTGTHMHLQTRSLAIPPILQEGLQGREIWSVDLCRFYKSGKVLCATSAEDNTIKISEWHDTLAGSLRTVFRYAEPDGTLQNVRWSRANPADTCNLETVILFATAAKERLFALKVTCSNIEGTTSVLKLGEAPRGLGQIDDSRTMTLDVLKLPGSALHAVLAGSSDGSLRLWHFDEISHKFTLEWYSSLHDRCLLSCRLACNSQKIWAVSGATDGRIAIWDLSRNSEEPACFTSMLQQSGVNCLDARIDREGVLHIASGGDDCSLAYTTLPLTDSAMQPTSICKADAHSSSLKGISILAPYRIVSTSTDQRLTCWQVLERGATGHVIERTSSVMTSVADVAGMSIAPHGEEASGHALVAVCGLGLELLQTSFSQQTSM